MRILFGTSEVYPFSKTGGLGDVLGALPQALAALGHEVLVVSPWYATLKAGKPLWIGDIEVPFDGGREPAGVGTLERDGVRYAFVGHADFQRKALYGYPDDVRRFCRFTRALAPTAARLGFAPEVAHVHDWHTAYLPMVLAHGWHLPDGFVGLPSVLTVHNVQYQGDSGLDETLYWLRLPGALRDSYMNHFGRANALQAGLGFASRVTTVSPSYAEEITRPEYGYGLDGTFRHIGDKLSGILNGLDYEVWDPGHDPALPVPYSVASPSGKRASKEALCRRFGLEPERPLLGVVSRLAEQKGIDVVFDAARGLLAQGWSLLVLGSGDDDLEARLRELSALPHVGALIGYDEDLAHLIYGGSDALLIPSRFEPCGLSQMIAMRYGTLPIARETGGLRDTIEHERSGFLFKYLNPEGLLWSTGLARQSYGTPAWKAMTERAMTREFAWRGAAERYLDLYRELRRSA